MKKIIYIFVIFISFFVFQINFKEQSRNERTRLQVIDSTIQKEQEDKYIYVLMFNKEKIQIDNILEFGKRNDITCIAERSLVDASHNLKAYYIYSPSGNVPFYTKNARKIDFSKEGNQYYSTDLKDQDSYDYIDFVDQRNHKSYQEAFEIHPLNQLDKDKNKIKESEMNKTMNFFFVTNHDKAKIKELLDKEGLLECLNDNTEIMEYEEQFENIEDDSLINMQLLTITLVSIFLLMICQALKEKKEITIRKMMGMSNHFILKKMFLKQELFYLCIYVIMQIVLFILYIGLPRACTLNITKQLLLFTLLFASLLLMIYGGLWLFIKFTNNYANIKNTSSIKKMNVINNILKLVMFIVVLQPLIQYTETGFYYSRDFFFLLKYKDDIKDRVYLSGLDDSKKDQILKYLSVHGNYYNFTNYEISSEQVESMQPFVIANENYLKSFNLKDDKGNALDYNKLDDVTLLIPDNMNEDVLENKSYYCNDCDAVKIKSGYTLVDYRMNSLSKTSTNPMIVFMRNPNDVFSFDVKTSKKAFIQDINKNGDMLGNTWIAETNDDYDISYEKGFDENISFFTLLFLYCCIILVVVYQNIFIYFIGNKNEFAIKYLMGTGFFQRHGNMIINNIYIYIPIIFWLYYVNQLSVILIATIVIIAICIELLLSYILIKKFEKKKIVEILKKDQ